MKDIQMQTRQFPVQSSTLSAEALVARVLKRYDLSDPVTCQFFRKGICDTYIIKTGKADRYLKIYMHGRRKRLDVADP